MEMTKILISKEEYDILRIQAVQLQIIQNAMEENMALYSTEGRPFLRDEFLQILKILFPNEYEDKYMELLEEVHEKEQLKEFREKLQDGLLFPVKEGDQ